MNTHQHGREIPLKTQIYLTRASEDLIRAVGNKTELEFLNSCDNPELLYEFMQLRSGSKGWPSSRQLKQRMFICASIAAVLTLIRARSAARNFQVYVLKKGIHSEVPVRKNQIIRS